MALGGGEFTTQNKKLPGSYINFVSAAMATATLSDRGYVTLASEYDWLADGVVTVTKEDAIKHSREIFGYAYSDKKLTVIRDLLAHATTLYLYRLNNGGVKASNTFGTAKCSGVRGNDIKIVIQANVDDASKFDVKTYLSDILVDAQTVASATELKNNDFVEFKKTATLAVNAGLSMTGGTNGTVTNQSHTDYLAAIESYRFNCIGCTSTDDAVKKLYVAFTKRMRDEVGVKFQLVVFSYKADFEGVISPKNNAAIVPWVVGAEGGCAVNASCTNMIYDGEADVDANYTQSELEAAIDNGEFVLHKVGDDIRVLTDINTLTTYTEDKGTIFSSNQTIRVIDQIGNDIAVLFNTKYIGAIANNNSGRISLWSDIVKHHNQLQEIGAIEEFSDDAVVVTAGNDKKSVVVADSVTIVNAMEKLYMTVTIQ